MEVRLNVVTISTIFIALLKLFGFSVLINRIQVKRWGTRLTAVNTKSNPYDRYLPPQVWLISSRLLLSCIPLTLRTQTWAMTWGGQGILSEGRRGGVEEEDEVLGPGAEEE